MFNREQPGGRYRPTHDMARTAPAEALLVNLLPLTERREAIQAFECQKTPILTVTDSDGISGTGYSYTVGAGGSSVMALLGDSLLPKLMVLTLRTSSARGATSKYLSMR